MAQITITGTADQIRRMGRLLQEAADETSNPRSVTVTLDNAVANSALSLTSSSGKKRDA